MLILSELLAQTLNSPALSLQKLTLSVFIAYGGGFLASLTPCVYPMIPITVSIVGGVDSKHASSGAGWDAFLHGFIYILGMALVYSFLGVIAGLSGTVFGSFISTSKSFLFFGGVLTLAALMMLDIFVIDFQKIHSLISTAFPRTQTITMMPQRITYLGAFFLGTSSGIIAAPCTTPILSIILAYIAKNQSVFLGFFLMISFSLGMGTLLLFLAAFTSALHRIPKAGAWMKQLKTLSGLTILIIAEYFIYCAGIQGGFFSVPSILH